MADWLSCKPHIARAGVLVQVAERTLRVDDLRSDVIAYADHRSIQPDAGHKGVAPLVARMTVAFDAWCQRGTSGVRIVVSR